MMDAVVWTLPDCPRCDKVKAALRAGGRPVCEKNLEKLRSGEEPDVDAMAQLMLTDELAPLVRTDDRFLGLEEIDRLIEEGDGCSNSNCRSLPR
jgi:glutaredoxin